MVFELNEIWELTRHVIDYVSNVSHPERTTPATGKVATDSNVSSEDPAVGDSSNSIVDDLVGSVEKDELHNMSAQKSAQKSDVAEAK